MLASTAKKVSKIFKIPESWRLTKNNQKILFHQEEGISICATNQGLELLGSPNYVLFDETFRCAPLSFFFLQIYPFFGTAVTNDEWTIPV